MWRIGLVVLTACGPAVTLEWPGVADEPTFVWSLDGETLELD